METLAKPQVFNVSGMPVGSRRDFEDKYRELRRPRKIRLLCNGDGHFRGKRVSVVPHRYASFNDLLTDLTNQLTNGVQLPYGVRHVYTPVSGTRVKDIDQLQDGQSYVCAGFEPFKAIKYVDEESLLNNGRVREQELAGYQYILSTNESSIHRPLYAFPLRQSIPGRFLGHHGARELDLNQWRTARVDIHGLRRPRIITIMRPGQKPIPTIRILLNRNSLQNYEQLVKDISDAFGVKWKENQIQKMYTVKGREVQGMSEFFRDDVFIGVGNEPFSLENVEVILNDLYPDNAYYVGTLMRYWDKDKSKHKFGRRARVLREKKKVANDDNHMDSGLGSEDGNKTESNQPQGEDRTKAGPDETDTTTHSEYDRRRQHEDKAKQRLRKKLRKQLVGNENLPPMREESPKRLLTPLAEKPHVTSKQRHGKRRDSSEGRSETNSVRRASVSKPNEDNKESKALPIAQKEATIDMNEKVPPIELSGDKNIDSASEPQVANAIEESQPPTEISSNKQTEDQHVDTQTEKTGGLKVSNANNEEQSADQPKQVQVETQHDKELAKPKAEEKVEESTVNTPKPVEKREEDAKPKKRVKEKPAIIQKSKLERQVSNAKHVLEKYELGKVLGDGNFAIVKQCKVPAIGQEFAMKIVDKSKLKGKETMIENEIAIMKLCDHPNIVKLFEEFETKDEIYLVMELVKGGDLFDAITKSTKFGEGQAAGISADICNALFYLHSRSIVHRDLKPENILVYVSKDGSLIAKLADFGLAMEVKELIFTVCGTPTYVAPEILTEKGYGLEVDLWALGVITYILLCGFPPFRSPERRQSELFQFIKTGDYEFLSPYWDRISRSAKDLIEHLLVVDRLKRYTAIDVLCHPWIMSHGEVRPPLDNLEERRRNLRKQLETQSKINLESFRQLRNG